MSDTARMLEAGACALGFAGDVVPGVTFAARRFVAVVQPDHEEIARRNAAGLGDIRDWDVVEALAQLPYRQPISWTDLDPIVRTVLDCAPAGVVESDDERVWGVWRPAVRVTGVYVRAWNGQAGIDRIGLLAVDAPVGLLLSRPGPPSRPLRQRAERGGVALAVREGDGWRPVLAARPWPVRQGPRHWRFVEAVYSAWQRHNRAVYPCSVHSISAEQGRGANPTHRCARSS